MAERIPASQKIDGENRTISFFSAGSSKYECGVSEWRGNWGDSFSNLK